MAGVGVRAKALARVSAAALAALSVAPYAPAQGVAGPDGAERTTHLDTAFDIYPLPMRRFEPGTPGTDLVEGRLIESAWRLPADGNSVEAVLGSYRASLREQGYRVLFECRTTGCGGFDFRFDAHILPAPDMVIDVRDFAQLSAGRGEGEYVSVLVSHALGSLYVQTVTVAKGDPEVALANEGAANAAEAVADGEMLRALDELGYAIVPGIAFNSGGASLSAESSAAVESIAAMMESRPDMRLNIVGHSDNQGGITENIALSRRRAEAVRDALVALGIAAGRLEAYGVGYLAPRTSNATPEGRLANRRVELVLD